jgi:hypothetical protein
VQMREDVVGQYLTYKLIDSNQDWKARWLYISNHHPSLPKPSGCPPKHAPWWNSEHRAGRPPATCVAGEGEGIEEGQTED